MDPFRRVKKGLRFLGFDPVVLRDNLAGVPFYRRDLAELKRQRAAIGNEPAFQLGPYRPIVNERSAAAGTMSGHYFHQDLHVARRIYESKPKRHIDIGSRVDGFVAHVAAYRDIEILDIRQLVSSKSQIHFRQADLMKLPSDLVASTDSLSSLHAVEHFGLGRYGDPIDYLGHEKAIANMARIVKPGGTFYFSTPIGPQRIEFNAHRVFSVAYLLRLLSTYFMVRQFSFVDDAGAFHENIVLEPDRVVNNYGCDYGCGVFELERLVN